MSKEKIKRFGGGKMSVGKEIKISSLKSKVQKLEQENAALKETVEVMSDKEIMQRISNGPSGPSRPLREVLKKHGYD